jgi:hypothetical protein
LLARSTYPSFLLSRVWDTKPARYLLISGLALALILLVWVSLAIPTRPAVVMGPGGLPGEPVASRGLLVLPLLNAFFFLAELALGLFFFRREDAAGDNAERALAYLLWSGAVLATLAFMVAVYFVLQAG